MDEGRVSSRELTGECLAAIERHADLNAFITVLPEALEEADRLDKEARQSGRRSPLHGIPFVVKDNVDVRGAPSTVASALFRQSAPKASDAAAIGRLRNAGAVFIGKTNLDELAAHVSGMTSAFGPTVNPYQPEGISYSPGGSSSGTAAAVASGMGLGGIGTDTGGSIRIPAGWCGLCGLRPTQGLISTYGIFPRAETLDTPGFITQNARDMDVVYSAFMDIRCDGKKRLCAKRMRIVIPASIFDVPMDPEVRESFDAAVETFRHLGFHVERKAVPYDIELYAALANVIRPYEFAHSIGQCLSTAQKNELHPLVRADLESGVAIGTETYIDALRQRWKIRHHLGSVFDGADLLMTPVTPCRPLPLSSPLEAFKRARTYMDLGSIAGLPSLAVSGGVTNAGLPAGIQLTGTPWQEMTLIRAGIAFEEGCPSSRDAACAGN